DADPLANFDGLAVDLEGTVATLPVITERSLRFELETTSVDDVAVHARVLVIADPAPSPAALHEADAGPSVGATAEPQLPSVGASLILHGRLRPNPGQPPRALLFPSFTIAEQASLGPLPLGARLRQAAVENIRRGLPEPQASLAAGVLLGGTGRLS